MHDYMELEWLLKDRCQVENTDAGLKNTAITIELPDIQRYKWESLCHPQPQIPGSTRGVKTVVVFTRSSSMIEFILCIRM